MLRIFPAENGNETLTLRVEGRMIGPWVEELRRSCEPIVARGARLVLDLSGVSFIDRDGARLLIHLQAGGARIWGCSPFVQEQLKAWSPRFDGCDDHGS